MTESPESTRQTSIQPFDDMNRYPDRHRSTEDGHPICSKEVYAPPRRTRANGWVKFHATRDCGEQNVRFVEHTNWYTTSERHEYKLYCFSCRHEVREDEVLFVGGDWWSEHGWRTYGRGLDDLYLPAERVLELGPDPDEAELKRVLDLGRIESSAGVFWGLVMGQDRWRECEDCGHAVPVRFDDRCRLCYDGEWTDRMQNTLDALERQIREHNGSFAHRLPYKVDPLCPGDRAALDAVLWRRHDAEGTDKLVVVTNRFEDLDDGHREYELTDPTNTNIWRYREEDLADCFWDTGLRRESVKAVMDDRIREVYQRVCEHSFHEVHTRVDGELVPDGEQCIHCRKRRGGDRA